MIFTNFIRGPQNIYQALHRRTEPCKEIILNQLQHKPELWLSICQDHGGEEGGQGGEPGDNEGVGIRSKFLFYVVQVAPKRT